jgi:hypothetical protein
MATSKIGADGTARHSATVIVIAMTDGIPHQTRLFPCRLVRVEVWPTSCAPVFVALELRELAIIRTEAFLAPQLLGF